MPKSITVSTTGRIQIALIDLHGSFSDRVDGSAGLALQQPSIQLAVTQDPRGDISVSSRESSEHPEIADDTKKALLELRRKFDLGGVDVRIESMLLPHAGFGSKTQALLAAGSAYCKLYGRECDVRQLADLLGRGGTSGIGVQTFATGGFVVDAGHSFKSKNYSFNPSSASTFASPPPVVGRYPFPDWPILIATPHHRKESFKGAEVAHWRKHTPIPLSDAQTCCQVVLMMLIPSVLESNLETFCKGINYIQQLAWKKSLREAQTPIVGETMAFLREIGVEGVGLSSAGATVYGLGPGLLEEERASGILRKTQEFLDGRGGGACSLTRASNRGALFS